MLKHFFIPSAHNDYRPHALGRTTLAVLFTVMLAAEGFLVATIIARQSGGYFLAAVEAATVTILTNEDRVARALPELRVNPELESAAQRKAVDMAARGYFAHRGPDGKEPWEWITEAGYKYSYAGENLAVRYTDSAEVVEAWMASPSHRANILKPVYTEIGVGVAYGMYQGAPAAYVVQYFGAPIEAAAVDDVPLAAAQTDGGKTISVDAGQVTAVAGQAVSASQPAYNGSLWRAILKALGSPRTSTFAVLAGILSFLIIALALTFLVHVQLQPLDLLLGGTVMAAFAACLLGANATFLRSTIAIPESAASVIAGYGSLDSGLSAISAEAATGTPQLVE